MTHRESLDPAASHFNAGVALTRLGRRSEAIAAYQKAVALRPDHVGAFSNMGAALRAEGKIDQAIEAYQRALAIEPGYAQIWSNLGNALRDAGRIEEAIDCFRRSLAMQPNPRTASNLLYALYFHPDYDAQRIYEEHVRCNDAYARPLAADVQPHENHRSPERRLRIGYVSPDFCQHCQSLFTAPLLANHDHRQFGIFCYCDVAAPDAMTEKLSACADQWRPIAGMPDEGLARMVRADGIDILVDLTVHMANNRLLAFARKPAPVQVTWLGYPGTSGLGTMDYRLSDPYLDPAGVDDAFYFEKTVRLPESFWCYDPQSALPVGALPASINGFTTFGCLNNFAKVNEGTLELWARILSAVPGSRLLLLAPAGSCRERVMRVLGVHLIDRTRVEFIGRQPRPQYLETYDRIDVGLETFPCNGHTTTLDAAWMGVPVPTMPGRTAVARGGTSILSNLGLGELIAASADEYVRIVSDLAHDLPRLALLRAGLRRRIETSPLMDAPRFVRGIEQAYRQMWRTWCGTHK